MNAETRLLDLLPEIFRTKDAEAASRIAAQFGFERGADDAIPEGPLTSLLAVLGLQFDALEAEVDNLYDDHFIETCADWVVPYIGALVGARIIGDDPESARRQVANIIADRRGKGTAHVLARRARAILLRPAEAVEYFPHLVTATHLDFPGDGRAMSVDLNGEDAWRARLPNHIGQHTAQLTPMDEGGRFAVPNIGVRSWPVTGLRHAWGEARPAPDGGPGAFRFSPTGADIPLWQHTYDRGDAEEVLPRLALDEIPSPIPMPHAVRNPQVYFVSKDDLETQAPVDETGQRLTFSVSVHVEGEEPITAAHFCNLADDPDGGWNRRARKVPAGDPWTGLVIDPVRGRLLLPEDLAGAETVRVTYFYGAAAEAGGGGYVTDPGSYAADFDLAESEDAPEPVVVTDPLDEPDEPVTFAEAQSTFASTPSIVIDHHGTLPLPAAGGLPPGKRLRLAAGSGCWPTLEIPEGGTIMKNGKGSELVLRGIRFVGGPLVFETNGLERVRLIDCTILPGGMLNPDGTAAAPKAISLDIRQPGLEVVVDRCVIGRIRLAETARIECRDSIVAAMSPTVTAIGGEEGPGGILSAERSTFIGGFDLRGMGEVSDCLFAVRPGAPDDLPLRVARLQQGCVRYSGLPEGAQVPRRYRCYPDHATEAAERPHFASLSPADAAFATLLPSTPKAILHGAENGGEMGWMNSNGMRRRLRVLDGDLSHWVPFATQAGAETMPSGE